MTFVGRRRELDALESALAAAEGGRGRLIWIAGEPGIGKTRLADALVERGAARGAKIAWARCWEFGGAPAYWPWTQPLRALGADAALAPAAGETERFALFERVAAALRDAA